MLRSFGAILTLSLIVVSSLTAEFPEEGRFYPNPGIVAYRNGRWVGSDHLYNLTNNIDIVVEIFKADNTEIPLTEAMVKARVSEVFKKNQIKPMAEHVQGKPLLPFFHVLLMIYPIENGYIVFSEGRLIEEVDLKRVMLKDQAVMQGVTWESENLLLSPKDQIVQQIYQSVDELAETFVDRYRFYQGVKSQIQPSK